MQWPCTGTIASVFAVAPVVLVILCASEKDAKVNFLGQWQPLCSSRRRRRGTKSFVAFQRNFHRHCVLQRCFFGFALHKISSFRTKSQKNMYTMTSSILAYDLASIECFSVSGLYLIHVGARLWDGTGMPLAGLTEPLPGFAPLAAQTVTVKQQTGRTQGCQIHPNSWSICQWSCVVDIQIQHAQVFWMSRRSP